MKSRNVESASRAVIALLFALAGTVLVGCSNSQAKSGFGGSDDPGGGGSMEIVSCSLGCNSFLSPQVTCNVNDVFVNEEIRIEFSQPVDISSLGPSTFRVQETSSGSVPPGTFSIDPSNPRGIIYRPLLSFDSMGSPTFGLTQGLTYSVFLPGANLDEDGPYILSTSGRPLLNRLQCFVTAASGINDLVPGAPSVSVDVNVVETDGLGQPVIDPMTGIPMLGARVNADGAVEVHRRSDIVMTFNDVMNPASLVNPVTGTSPTIRVFLDPDGDVADPGDRLELFGRFEITIDQDQLTTIVRFDPDTDFPSAGTQPTPRRIVVELPNSIVDLGGNPLNLDNTISFVSERLAFPPAVLVEDFGAALAFDDGRSGAEWGPVRLAGTRGGGSGRLGDLVVAGGTMLTLYTDGMRPKLSVNANGVPVGQEVDGMGVPQFVPQLFGPTELVTVAGEPETTFGLLGSVTGVTPNIELDGDSQNLRTVLIDNYDPADSTPFDAGVPGSGPAPGQSTYQVTDGIFEFASVRIDPGSVLRILGPHPPRLYSRGEALIRGRIEVRGVDVELPHDSSSDLGGLGAIGGPGGGRGGNGGQRPDGGGDLETLAGGVPNPSFTMLSDADGLPGEGYLFPSSVPGAPMMVGGGPGGTRWPNATQCGPTMTCDLPPTTNPTLTDFGGLVASVLPTLECFSGQVGGPGGGASRALDGGAGVAMGTGGADPPGTVPPSTPGGSFPIGPGDLARTLSPENGFLVGGAGGGGSGGHIRDTERGGAPFCTGPILTFRSHSGAGGGGGGGALQIQAGNRLALDGVIDASGGRGGEPLDPGVAGAIDRASAVAGGSGSGGSLLLQAPELTLGILAGRIDIDGGPATVGAQSMGGEGSPGLVRVEAGSLGNGTVPSFGSLARAILPFDPANAAGSGDWLSLNAAGWERLEPAGLLGTPQPLTGAPIDYLPDTLSGAQSCWLRPPGNYFRLDFDADQPGQPGWGMNVVLADGTVVPYRGNPAAFEETSAAVTGLTSALDDPVAALMGSAIVVRFQGIRAVRDVDDFCDAPLTGPDSPFQLGSLTPWVLHPAELNAYWEQRFPAFPGEVSKRRPTLIRFQILFDREALEIQGVDDLFIRVQPD